MLDYPVKAVFAAHDSRYEQHESGMTIETSPSRATAPRFYGFKTRHVEKRIIQYYTTGGGGAELNDPPEVGGFHHWLLVTANEQNVRVVVMRDDGTNSPTDVILAKNRDDILAAHQEIKMSAGL